MITVNSVIALQNLRDLYDGSFYFLQAEFEPLEKKCALRSITNRDLKVSEKPKLNCLGFAYNGAELFNTYAAENPNTFKTMTKDWIWENIPSY